MASAFVVNQIHAPEDLRISRPLKWFRVKERTWETSRVPTRGEYLVEIPQDEQRGPHVHLLLSLIHPFVVWVR
jgi:hypothetical protein